MIKVSPLNERIKEVFFLIFSLPCPRSPSSCASEMERWVEDIRMAIDLAEQSNSPQADLLTASLSENSKPHPLEKRIISARVYLLVSLSFFHLICRSSHPLLSLFFSPFLINLMIFSNLKYLRVLAYQ